MFEMHLQVAIEGGDLGIGLTHERLECGFALVLVASSDLKDI
jgi:hypothetical protein